MKNAIIETHEPVTLIGGGTCTAADIETARAIAPTTVAADSGAHMALKQGVPLAAVIGDMDSISNSARAQIPKAAFHEIAEQDSTDFDKALRNTLSPLVVAAGFSGGHVDHTLAAFHTLLAHCHRRVIVLAEQDIVFLCPPHLALAMAPGTRVSLFPMGRVRGTSRGLRWPVDGIGFAPGLRSGTSNQATGDIDLTMDRPNMLCILPRALIRQVASCFLAPDPPALWPVRAE